MIFLFSLFKITSVYLKCSVTHIKILKGALWGAAGMCLLLILPFGKYLKYIFGYGILNVFLIRYIFQGKNIFSLKDRMAWKRTLQIAVCVMVTAMLLGGSLVASKRILRLENTTQISIVTLMEGMLICKSLQWILKNKKQKIYSVKLFQGEKNWCVEGLFDTGNSLVEPISGKPVSVLQMTDSELELLPKTGYRIIPYRSVGTTNGLMDGYIFDKLEIAGPYGLIHIKYPIVAISKQPLSTTGTYRMILHPKLFVESEE